jgi:hypothetical protein
MALGVLASIILIAVGATLNPFDYTENVTHSDRISIAVQSGILIAFCLAITIGRLAKHRSFSTEDIDGSGLTDGSSKAKVLQSLLQNTIEQSILAILVYMAWAVIMPASWLSVIPLAAFASKEINATEPNQAIVLPIFSPNLTTLSAVNLLSHCALSLPNKTITVDPMLKRPISSPIFSVGALS